MRDADLPPLYWTVPIAEKQTGLPHSWFYNRFNTGGLPGGRKAGKYLLIRVDEFLSALEKGDLR